MGLYSGNDFDAIGGAVGILFVHDLDEKVFASMQLFRGTSYAVVKKLIATSLWVILSITIAAILACRYEDGSYFNATGEFQCRDYEFQCGDTSCIWAGFVCNGVEDCSDGSDEGILGGCNYAAFNYCPEDTPFQCVEDGSCLQETKKCNGILDCPDGSDEGRSQNCTEVIRSINCGQVNITNKYPNSNDTYLKLWSGGFRCNNGQCIDAQYVCDGQPGIVQSLCRLTCFSLLSTQKLFTEKLVINVTFTQEIAWMDQMNIHSLISHQIHY